MPVDPIEIEPDMTPDTRKTVRETIGAKFRQETEDQPKTSTRKSSGTKAEREAEWTRLREDLTTAYEFMGSMLVYVSPNGGQVMHDSAEQCADVWVSQAQKSERVKRFLTAMTEGSGWVAIGLAHMPIALAILHDRSQQVETDDRAMTEDELRQRYEEGIRSEPERTTAQPWAVADA